MKSRNFFLYVVILITAIGLTGCYPSEKDISFEDLDIAITGYDKDYYAPGSYNHYQEFQTFVIPDTVIHIIEAGVPDNITRDFDKFVLDQVKSNMLKLGYVEETDPGTNPPDLAVTVSVTTSEHIDYNWYDYWSWYWAAEKKGKGGKGTIEDNNPWGPFYGWNTSYSYNAGSVIMEIVDNAKVDLSTQAIPVIWAGLINGATEGSTDNIKSRLSTGIDQCFNQSPYLFK
jgi:hypothetical protein